MDLPFELFVAIRYLLARRKQAFISLISFISGLGVMVGVMALLIALALMTGLQGELLDRLDGSTAHVYVFKVARGGLQDYDAEVAKLLRIPHVIGAAPAVLGKEVAAGLGANVGDSVSVLTLQGTLTPMGMMPRTRTLRVVGVFGLGLYEFDSEYA